MNTIEKLKQICVNEGFEYFVPYFLTESDNWPLIPLYIDYDDDGKPIPEDDPEMEPLNLENWRVTEIGERNMTIKCGGDWQPAYEVKFELNEKDEFVVVEYEECDFSNDEEINMNELLGLDDSYDED